MYAGVSLRLSLSRADMSADGILQPAMSLASYELCRPSAIPRSRDAVEPLIEAAVDVFWQCRRYGEPWDDVAPPQSYLDADEAGETDVGALSRRVHRRLVFDLVAEILRDAFDDDAPPPPPPPWPPRRRPPPRRPRRFAVARPPPTTVDGARSVVERHALACLGVDDEPAAAASRKRGVDRRLRDDAVDRMLVEELSVEEPGWVDYDDDVTTRKLQLADWLSDALVGDTAHAVEQAARRRRHALAPPLDSLV